ncbi:LysM peptidoglycan-binding domain-containing protein [Fictibacillus nanhaiensis]|uniref:glycosyl hydrolase family 18 protein n=1 Tax=Fictibacillus nanhaiensis TaxID=742169 RepID=UPI001C983A70|nr:glycosyl hydrolase family 18 protein [Fictibacillus nanhaiensis]MBY6035731.1 LysM peptidoglycan-binding domain-containing protein [Fictibacillus nanhaiensis]
MQIHVVKKGDSLWKLSQFYRLPWQELATVNRITEKDILTVGQTLLIPTPFTYTVQLGDTLQGIANKIGVNLVQLQQANPGVTDMTLTAGVQLNVPQRKKRSIVTNVFAEPVPKARENFKAAAKGLSYITLFSYEVNEKGELKPLDDTEFLSEIKNENVRPIMAITNIKDGEFSEEVGTAILTNEDITNKVIEDSIKIMKQKGYQGISVDFEFLGKKNKEAYNQFLKTLTDKMHKEGFIVMTAVAPKISATQIGEWYESHDYKAHGEIVDYVILMTYEWGYSGGPPLAVSPIPSVKKVLDYAVREIDRKKILMGINLYGYDWTLPYKPGGKFAKALNPVQATQLAGKRQAAIQYSKKDEAPYFSYWDKDKKEHIVWFEDLRSMKAKFDIVDQYGFAGVSFWNLSFAYPVFWNYLIDRYDIK